MKITKFEHACFSVEHNGATIIVDPGEFTSDLVIPTTVVAIVITHEHGDHFSAEKIQAIAATNPTLTVIAHESITSQLGGITSRAVAVGGITTINDFELQFFGGEHAIIHSDIPVIPNLGVLINNTIFYPGDSFAVPALPIEVLALPVGAPWLKISEVIDYLIAVKPRLAFPTHDGVLSDNGKQIPDNRLPSFAATVGTTYQRLHEPLEL